MYKNGRGGTHDTWSVKWNGTRCSALRLRATTPVTSRRWNSGRGRDRFALRRPSDFKRAVRSASYRNWYASRLYRRMSVCASIFVRMRVYNVMLSWCVGCCKRRFQLENFATCKMPRRVECVPLIARPCPCEVLLLKFVSVNDDADVKCEWIWVK